MFLFLIFFLLLFLCKDHYGGLSADFNSGRIYCSPSTAALSKLRLKVRASVLTPLAVEVKHTIIVGGAKVDVTLMDANHCPGSVIILFEFRNGRKVLHTGDFRYVPDMLLKSPALRTLAGLGKTSNIRNLIVYLDTTYCDPQYTFPPQPVAIQAVIDVVSRERRNNSERTLFVFGAYGIGKERLFMAVAHEFGLHVRTHAISQQLCVIF